MTTELKVTVSDDTLDFLRENFPEGLSDAGRARMAIGIVRFVMDEETGDLMAFLRAEGLTEIDDLDLSELYVESLKRAILDSDEIDLGALLSDEFSVSVESETADATDDADDAGE